LGAGKPLTVSQKTKISDYVQIIENYLHVIVIVCADN